MMNISDAGIAKLKQLEGSEPRVYKDSAGLPTIGVGHLLKKGEIRSGKINMGGKYVDYRNGLSTFQIDQLLKQDLVSREQAVSSVIRVPLSENQFDTLVIFVFNIGREAFRNSTLARILNEGKYNLVPEQLRRWVHSAGQKIDGLINRREAEVKLWNDNTVPERRNTDARKNVAVTLEWLMKRSPTRILAETFDGKKLSIRYDHDIQQFRIEE